ncbi:MAG: AraC family transcriptional regulator [Lacrimispora sp.]|uniref:helix-turn-helix domain-containing protein n=1 Tax=Lacrimispora sp. TaxID=2719234 RepID=UPI0039E4B0C0
MLFKENNGNELNEEDELLNVPEVPFTKVFSAYRTEITGIIIRTAGYSQTAPGHIWGPGIRTYYLLHYVISGKGWYNVGNERHWLSEGDLFFSFPNEIIKYGADLECPWKYCWVGFLGLDIPYIIKQTGFTKKKHTLHIPSDDIARTMIDLYKNYGTQTGNYLYMISKLAHLLSIIILHSKSNPPIPKGSDYLEKALTYMKTEYQSPVTINEIASFAGISSSHLYRLFMKEYSVAPLKYLTQFRIQCACNMLIENMSLPVSVIAYSVGFNDPLYFSRSFRKAIGVSPSEYRKMNS